MSKLFSELEKKIQEEATKYYTDGSQSISDEEFDSLVDELRSVNPSSEVLKTGWGLDINSQSGTKFKHLYGHIGSLEKVRTAAEIKKAFPLGHMFASLKLDGISIVLYYENGNLQHAVTRGDGEFGIEVTDKILIVDPRLSTIPDRVFTGAVRGEIIMKTSDFEEYQKKVPEAKNPRNSVAGLINSKEASEHLPYLSVMVYTVVGAVNIDYDAIVMNNMIEFLSTNFPSVAPYTELKYSKGEEEFIVDDLNDLRDRWSPDIPYDGIVLSSNIIMVKDKELQYESVAFKFPAERVTTTVKFVEWTMSKNRFAVPRVCIEPVQLAGTTVEWCTGFNYQFIKDNKIGRGSVVEVEKRGEIIPNIVNVVSSSSTPADIYTCPVCQCELTVSGVHKVCTNPQCQNALYKDLTVFVDKIAPVDGMKETLLLNLLQLKFPEDVLSIDFLLNNLDRIEIAKDATGHLGLLKQVVDKLKGTDGYQVPLKSAIEGLNIPRFGDVTAAKLAEHPDLVKELSYIDSEDQIIAVISQTNLATKIGEANCNSLKSNWNKLRYLRYLYDRDMISVESSSVTEYVDVAITGKLSCKRADFEKELKEHGYLAKEISKHTKFLITDDPNSNSSKNKKADEWGIVKVTEHQFRECYLR